MDTFRDWYSSIKVHLYSAAYILYSIKNPPVVEDNVDQKFALEWISFRDTHFCLNLPIHILSCFRLFASPQNAKKIEP